MAFLSGSIGVIYRQFSVTMVSAMILSVFVALVLTPAMCATLLKPVSSKEQHASPGFFAWFNRTFERITRRYHGVVGHMLNRPVRYLAVYLALISMMGLLLLRLPGAFLPAEDQSYLYAMLRGPVGATQERTFKAMGEAESVFLNQEKDAVNATFMIAGFNFGGGGQNSGIGFVELKGWNERKSDKLGITAVQDRANATLSQIKDAEAMAFAPPPIPELGSAAGFAFYLHDDFGKGHRALTAARDQFLTLASKSKLLAEVRPTGQEDAPQFHLDIDPQKALSFGLSMNDVNESLAVAWGGRYIDDFIDRERVKRVIIQSDAPFRMVPEDFSRWHIRNDQGHMVSVASFSKSRWEYGSPRLERYNGLSAMEINGNAAAGVSSGDAMKEVERLVTQLPTGFSVSFVGQSFEELAAGAQTPMLYTLSLIFVFLWLAALYESWSIPVAIMLAVPLGIVGAVISTTLRGLERDIYFQVAMLTTIGLTAKNAILVIEFAQKNVLDGLGLVAATLDAVRVRLRPILMTSLAFGFGVLPLTLATGAGSGAQRAIGTGVFGGMLAGTFLGIFFIPLLFVTIRRFGGRSPAGKEEVPLRSPEQIKPGKVIAGADDVALPVDA